MSQEFGMKAKAHINAIMRTFARTDPQQAQALMDIFALYGETIDGLQRQVHALEQRIGHVSEEPKPVGQSGPALRG